MEFLIGIRARYTPVLLVLAPLQSSCLFDGLTGSRPDRSTIAFTILTPDTIGVDDTLRVTLTDRVGFTGTEPSLRVLLETAERTKASWAHESPDHTGATSQIVMSALDTALLVGIDTGRTQIVARLIAPELGEGVADTADLGIVPKLAFLTQPPESLNTGDPVAVEVAVLDGNSQVVTEPRLITLSLGLLSDSDSLVRVFDRADEDATFFFGDVIVPAESGIARFDQLTIFTPGAGYTLVASSGKLTRTASQAFRVGQLVLRPYAGNDQTHTVDTQVAIPPTVQLINESGRPVSGSTISFQVIDGGGSISATEVSTNDSGLAFVEWRLGTNADPGTNELEAFVRGAIDVQSVHFTAQAIPDAPHAITLDTQPSQNAVCSVPFDIQPVARLLDQFANRTSDTTVSIAAGVVSGGGELSGTTTIVTGADGRAAFTNLALNGPPEDHRVEFTSAGLSSATTNSIRLSEGAPSVLEISVPPPAIVNSGDNFDPDPEVTLVDACDNPLQGFQVTVAINSGDGTLNGNDTDDTNSSGVATFQNLSIDVNNPTAGSFQFILAFSVPGLAPVLSQTINVIVPSPSPPEPPQTRSARALQGTREP